jgi:hypothetical protein
MRLRKILYFLIVLLWPLSLASAEVRDQKLYVAYDRGLLSVSLENAELEEVLEVIGEKTGISIRSPEDLNKSITINFDRLPLEEGLYRILRGIDHVLIFSSSDKEIGKETVSGVYIPSDKITGKRAPGTTRSVPRRTKPEEEEEDDLEEEEILGGVREYGEEQEEDAVLERYERELDRLEEQMEMVEEDSPQGKAIMSRIQRLQTQIERRFDQLERQESQ